MENTDAKYIPLNITWSNIFPQGSNLFVLEFEASKTVPEQVSIIKKLCNVHSLDPNLYKLLTELYFNSPLKHPVRNQALRLIQQNSKNIKSTLAESLNQLIKRNLHESSKCLNQVVTSVHGCFENFPLGLQAIEVYLEDVINFTCYSLEIYLNELSLKVSPIIKNQFHLYIHNAIRFLLSCTQEFMYKTVQSIQKEKLDEILYMKIIPDDNLPTDIRTNSGILLAYIARSLNTYEKFCSNILQNESDMMCLCQGIGLINTMSLIDFKMQTQNIEDILKKFYSIAKKYSSKICIVLAITRSILQFSRNFSSYTMNNFSNIKIKKIFDIIINFTLTYLEYNIDSIRHLCKDIMKNCINLAANIDNQIFFKYIINFCLSKETSLYSKCTILHCLSNTAGIKFILDHLSDIQSILAIYLDTDIYVRNCYENLMLKSYKEINFSIWKTIWLDSLLKNCSDNENILQIVHNILNKSIKYDPNIGYSILELNDTKLPISMEISILWTLRKNGSIDNSFEILPEKVSNYLKPSILSNCDETKLATLKLISETHKTTEKITKPECDLILLYIKYNCNCQKPATREKSLGLIIKFLKRLEMNIFKIKSDNDLYNHFYINFLKNVIDILLKNFFPNANFSRKVISLNLIKEILVMIKKLNIDIYIIFPKNSEEVIFRILNDSYDVNKVITLSILKLLKNDSTLILTNLKIIEKLMTSIRPNDSISAAYYLEYFCNNINIEEAKNIFDVIVSTSYEKLYLCALIWCIRILKKGIISAKTSILLAACSNPLYGQLFVIHHLLNKVNLKKNIIDNEWRTLISDLIELCKNLIEIVSPIVNNASPEGYLPNDFLNLSEYSLNDGIEISSKVKPQMVLICGWRTVKEVSSILGDIVIKSSIDVEQNEMFSLLTEKQVLEIGNLFLYLLLETKHRGAFEQAYCGFSKYCQQLWLIKSEYLNELPMKWLSEFFNIILNDQESNLKICATRRSAGIPYLIQALIISELKVDSKKLLEYSMHNLFENCINANIIESRVHAMNILSTIFRSTDLSDHIGGYITDGLICSIRGHGASTWAERNTSTLLFSTLMMKIFGVKRKSDTKIFIKIKMAEKMFFLKYPKLYDFFLKELEENTSLLKTETNNKLLPILLIFSRLYPSVYKETGSYSRISSFLPLIENCASNSRFQIRVLAAKAIPALTSKDCLLKKTLEILKNLVHIIKSSDFCLNKMHCLLLQVYYLIKYSGDINKDNAELIALNIAKLSNILQPNPVLFKTIFDILVELNLRCRESMSKNVIYNLLNNLFKREIFYQESFSFSYPLFRKSFLIYLFKILSMIDQSIFQNFLLKIISNFNCVSVESIETCLNLIIFIIKPSHDEIIDELEIDHHDFHSFQILEGNMMNIMKNFLIKNNDIVQILIKICKQEKFFPQSIRKAYYIISNLCSLKFDTVEFILESKNCHQDVRDGIIRCIEAKLKISTSDFKEIDVLIQFLNEISMSSNPEPTRILASKILMHISSFFEDCIKEKRLNFSINFVIILLRLLNDDDITVRTNASNIVSKLTNLTNDNIVDTYAKRIFIEYLEELLIIDYDLDFIKKLLHSIILQYFPQYSIENVPSTNICEIFEKSESNAFGEPYQIILDIIEIFSKSVLIYNLIADLIQKFQIL